MNTTVIGLDIAKQIFHLIGLDATGKQVEKKTVVAKQKCTVVFMTFDIVSQPYWVTNHCCADVA